MALPQSLPERVLLLDRYVRIRTLSGSIGPALVSDVQAFFQELGLELQPLTAGIEGETPALYGEITADLAGPTILLYGHYDVQPPGNLDAWSWEGLACDPWVPRYFARDEQRGELEPRSLPDDALARTVMVGRGSADNKGQNLGNILGVLELKAAGRLPANVKVLLDGEEERGSPSLRAIAERHRGLLRADLLIGSDGPKQNDAPTIVLGVRGLLGAELRVDNGRGQSLHSGNYGNVAESAVLPLARMIAALPERVAAVAGRHGAFRRSVLAQFAEAPDRALWEPFLQPTANVNGIISEGVTPGKRRTIIPGWALATIDVRLTPDTPIDEIAEVLQAVRDEEALRTPGVSIALDHNWGTPASYTPPGRPEFTAILEATRAYWQRDPVVVPLLGGTLPAFVFTNVLGMPAYWLPGAQSNNRQHDVNEHLLLDHYFRQSGWYAAVLQSVSEALGPQPAG